MRDEPDEPEAEATQRQRERFAEKLAAIREEFGDPPAFTRPGDPHGRHPAWVQVLACLTEAGWSQEAVLVWMCSPCGWLSNHARPIDLLNPAHRSRGGRSSVVRAAQTMALGNGT